MTAKCPACGSPEVMFVKKRQVHLCGDCSHEFVLDTTDFGDDNPSDPGSFQVDQSSTHIRVSYVPEPAGTLLACLLGLALIEAALGVMYFMHLKYERPALFWSLIPYLVFALVMMDHFWPDALRLMRQRMPGQ